MGKFTTQLLRRATGPKRPTPNNSSALYLSPPLQAAVTQIVEQMNSQGISVTPGLRPVIELMALARVQHQANPYMWPETGQTPREQILKLIDMYTQILEA